MDHPQEEPDNNGRDCAGDRKALFLSRERQAIGKLGVLAQPSGPTIVLA